MQAQRKTRTGLSVVALAALSLVAQGVAAQPITPGQLAGEYIGQSMFVDEFYRRTSCKRPPSLPANAGRVATDYVVKNASRIRPGMTGKEMEEGIQKLVDDGREDVRRQVTRRLNQAGAQDAEYCAAMGGEFIGSLRAALSSLDRVMAR